jgi:hypothetical protein
MLIFSRQPQKNLQMPGFHADHTDTYAAIIILLAAVKVTTRDTLIIMFALIF